MEPESAWTTEYDEGGKFEVFFLKLKPYEQAVVQACIEQVLERLGQDICESRWGTALGGGLFEFRIDSTLRSLVGEDFAAEKGFGGDQPRVLVRLFCAFHGKKLSTSTMGTTKARTQARSVKRKK